MSRLLLGMFVCASAVSCAPNGDPYPDPASSALQSASQSKILFHGRSFSWVRAIPQSAPNSGPDGIVTQDVPPIHDEVKERAYEQYLNTLSDAAYAEKLRLVIALNGNEYRADDAPDLNTVAQIRRGAGTQRGESSLTLATPPSGTTATNVETKTSPLLVDTRVVIDNFSQPGSSVFVVRHDTSPPMQNMSISCSGAIIGPHTGIAAAHCFYDVATQTYRGFQYLATGEDDLRSPNTPWGAMTVQCFATVIYVAFQTDGSSTSKWDEIALDFSPCGSANPGASGAGFLGYWVNHNPGSASLNGDGYASGTHCGYAQVCGSVGTGFISGWLLESSTIFNKFGMSGGPIFSNDGNMLFFGHITAVDPNTTYANWFNTTVYNLMKITDSTRFP